MIQFGDEAFGRSFELDEVIKVRLSCDLWLIRRKSEIALSVLMTQLERWPSATQGESPHSAWTLLHADLALSVSRTV